MLFEKEIINVDNKHRILVTMMQGDEANIHKPAMKARHLSVRFFVNNEI